MVYQSIHRFIDDRRGNITTMFALSMPVILFGVGAAIDFGRAAQVRGKLDNAAYAAAVAALASGTSQNSVESAKAAAVNMFNAQIGGVSGLASGATTNVTVSNPNGNPLIQNVTVCYAAAAQTPVVGIVGAATQQLGDCVTATGQVASNQSASPSVPLSAAKIVAPWPSTAGIHVPAGCGAPAPSAHTFYVDPVLGKPTNKGTSASPWDLATALSQAWAAGGGVKGLANPVVHLGDTFLLASGNYGDLLLQGYYGSQVGYDNKSQFLTIKAAPGATPVFTSIRVMGAGGWVFQGLTVKQIAPNLPANNYAALVAIQGDDHDIIFDGNTIEFATSVTSWTQANWLANAATGISQGRSDANGTKCLSLTNNAISNVSYGITDPARGLRPDRGQHDKLFCRRRHGLRLQRSRDPAQHPDQSRQRGKWADNSRRFHAGPTHAGRHDHQRDDRQQHRDPADRSQPPVRGSNGLYRGHQRHRRFRRLVGQCQSHQQRRDHEDAAGDFVLRRQRACGGEQRPHLR